jgi:ribosomal protein S6
MNRYEVLILTVPELTKDEELSIEKNLEKLLMSHKGSIISFDRWGKYQLAYPVKLHDYGVYFLVRFEIDGKQDILKEIRTLFHIKFNEFVMRHVITKLSAGQSLEYKKPQSLEDAPKKHVGFFDKKDSGNSRPSYNPVNKDSHISDHIDDIDDIVNPIVEPEEDLSQDKSIDGSVEFLAESQEAKSIDNIENKEGVTFDAARADDSFVDNQNNQDKVA